MTAGIISGGRSHMVLNSALQASHGTSADEEVSFEGHTQNLNAFE